MWKEKQGGYINKINVNHSIKIPQLKEMSLHTELAKPLPSTKSNR